MKSGLEGRNNTSRKAVGGRGSPRLNEVRPRRPEQFDLLPYGKSVFKGLNEVRPRRPEQSTWAIIGPRVSPCLNEVRPRRPEQFAVTMCLSSGKGLRSQ